MGDMADFALEAACDEDEHFMKYQDAPMETQYEEGLIDEYGALIGNPYNTPVRVTQFTKASGPGECPRCGSDTIHKHGRFGSFYGCTEFPKCRGSRKV